ncbi:MAG: hypothetical protein SGJ19_09080 [Planctomycetia bacterium]|nr:hypothetical protein [Planctomycetia bacterium]
MFTQAEANSLIALPKKAASDVSFQFPRPGKGLAIPLVSMDDRLSFLLDIGRGRIRLTKCTYQNRYEQVTILVRLDLDGPPHTNPSVEAVPLEYLAIHNGAVVPCPHLHIYVAGFGDRWAIPAPESSFPATPDLFATLDHFMQYCNVVEPPVIEKVLF